LTCSDFVIIHPNDSAITMNEVRKIAIGPIFHRLR
jgi:hypothetical protein